MYFCKNIFFIYLLFSQFALSYVGNQSVACFPLSLFPGLSYRLDNFGEDVVHDDVIKWKHFPRYWPFVWGIHRWPVNSQHKGQWRGALMLSLFCAWMYDWVNNRAWGWWFETPHDVTVMFVGFLGTESSKTASHYKPLALNPQCAISNGNEYTVAHFCYKITHSGILDYALWHLCDNSISIALLPYPFILVKPLSFIYS